MHETKLQLLQVGLTMLLERGYNDLGVQALLEATGIPKGSFYYHFRNKEDFALQVVDLYMSGVHQGLDAFLSNEQVAPLQRVRNFFEATRDSYQSEGYLGCMLGSVGQELAGASPVFRAKIEACFTTIGGQLAACLELAQARGELPASADPARLSVLLVNCWEGAALRSRLRRSADPLDDMLDFYLQAAVLGEFPRRG